MSYSHWQLRCFSKYVRMEKENDSYRSNHVDFNDIAVLSPVHSVQPHGLPPVRLLSQWEFSRQEYWSGLPCPPPGDLPDPGIKTLSLASPALAGGFFLFFFCCI